MKQEQACDSKYESDLEHQQRCKYISDLGKSSSTFADYSKDRYAYQVYDQFPNHVEYAVTDDGLDNYIFLADHKQCVSNVASSSYFDQIYEEEVVAPQLLTFDIGNQFPFLTYNAFKEHFNQEYYLQSENKVEYLYTNHVYEETFQ